MKVILSHWLKSIIFKILVVIIAFLNGGLNVFAQTGPAGVGNASSNKVWLDASFLTGLTNGSRLNNWTDRSGNSWSAYQTTASRRPGYIGNELNGHPVIRFDRTNGGEWLDLTATGIGAVMNNSSTLFAVAKANSGGANDDRGQWQSVFGAIDAYSGILFQGFPTATHFYIDGWVGNPAVKDLVVRGPITQGEWYVATRMPIELGNGTTMTGYVNGTHVGSNFYNLQLKNHNNFVRMGASAASGTHQYLLNGDIAEIILFNVNLNDAQRIIIDNYLSAKYNLPTANDYYSNHDADFIKDVQGIGTTDGSSNKHIAAGNSKGLLLSQLNNTLDSPNEFLFSGHASASNAWVETDLPSGEQSRWQRSWYLEKTGVIDVKLSFDFSQAGLVPEVDLINNLSNYKLLYRSAASGNFSIVQDGSEVLVPTLENADQLVFALTNAQLNNGYYTIAYSPSLTWTGAVSTQWDLPGNWNLNRIPTSSDHVYVNECITCPVLDNSVSIAGIKLNNNSILVLGNNTLTVSGSAYLDQTKMKSNQGTIIATDFLEIKNSVFTGSITLEKTGGSNNNCYGGNIFSPELKIINSSNNEFSVSTQLENVVKNF